MKKVAEIPEISVIKAEEPQQKMRSRYLIRNPFLLKWCRKIQRKISLWNEMKFFSFAVQNINDIRSSSCVLCPPVSSCVHWPLLQLWVNSSTGESGWKDGSHAVTNGSWRLAAVHPRILGCAGAADCGGAGQKGQGLPQHSQEHRPAQTQTRPGGGQAAAPHLRRRPPGTHRDPTGRRRSILLQEPEGETCGGGVSLPSAQAPVAIPGQLSATRAERLHHFRSLLDSEIGLVSFDLQSRSGCCPLTVCLWGDEKKKKKKRTWQSFSESLCFGMWYAAGWEDYPKIENK